MTHSCNNTGLIPKITGVEKKTSRSKRSDKEVSTTCPSYAAKSVVGQRFSMEDTWAAIPEFALVPRQWTQTKEYGRDQLPALVPPLAPMSGLLPPRDQSGSEGRAASGSALSPTALSPAAPAFADHLAAAAASTASTDAKLLIDRETQTAASSCRPSHDLLLVASEDTEVVATTLEESCDISPSNVLEGAAGAFALPLTAVQGGTTGKEEGPILVHFFAVYDGHGGAEVAKHCSNKLHEYLKDILASTAHLLPGASAAAVSVVADTPASPPAEAPAPAGEDIIHLAAHEKAEADAARRLQQADEVGVEAALMKAFLQTDRVLAAERSAHEVGSTAVVALLAARHLWVANCGESEPGRVC